MFRGIDAVMNALYPALVKNKVFIVPTILEQQREERTTTKGGVLIYSICKIKYTFYAEDGSNIECIVVGEGMDSGDKATNKAMSVAFKYACFQTFCIPTEEMKEADPDNEVHEVTEERKPLGNNKPATESQKKRMREIADSLGKKLRDEDMEKITMAQASQFIKEHSKEEK